MVMRRFKVRKEERGLLFRDGSFERVLAPGVHWLVDPLRQARVDVASVREVFLKSAALDVIARSGALGREAEVLDLRDDERALVFVDGRFEAVLKPGLHVVWTVFRKVDVERLDARASGGRLEHPKLSAILGSPTAALALDVLNVEAGQSGLVFRDGRLDATLGPGTYAFWKGIGRVKLQSVDRRERVLDLSGQEIMTSDKVTLRLNAVVTYRVADPVKAVTSTGDLEQSLYREAQLALRAVIGTRDLDALLADRDGASGTLASLVRERAAAFGLEVVTLGIRDVVLPGEMKDLFNKVTEAKKAAEATLITRREETAAMRSQANTARLLEGNPMLMRLRELEALEKVAGKAKLSVVLGEKGLTDQVVRLV